VQVKVRVAELPKLVSSSYTASSVTPVHSEHETVTEEVREDVCGL